MSNMKRFLWILSGLFMAFSVVMFSSCEKSDDDSSSFEEIQRVWIWDNFTMYMTTGESNVVSKEMAGLFASMSFSEGGKVTVRIVDNQVESSTYGEILFDKFFDFSVTEDELIVGGTPLTYELSDNQLKIYGHGEWLAQEIFVGEDDMTDVSSITFVFSTHSTE